MPPQKLPEYFEKFLNEKFDNVLDEIQDVKDEVKDIKQGVNKLNGSVQGNVKKIEENRNDIEKSKLYIKILGCVILGIIIFLLGATENALLHSIKSIFALF